MAKTKNQKAQKGQKASPPPAAARHAARYDRRQAGKNEIARKVSAAGREIGDLPPVEDRARRDSTELDFRRFCETYLATTFTLAWSEDHLRVIAKIEAAVLRGELFAFAMPRGSGKSSIIEAAALWAMLFGHRDFTVIVGADEGHARRMLDNIWAELETSEMLLADFPEVCYPIARLERIPQRCRGQLHHGTPTRMIHTASEIVLPTIEGSRASGGVLSARGITGGLRGMAAKRADGTRFRPSLVLVDDPATDEVASSPAQVAARLDVMRGAILGLAGPGKTIAGLCTLTVIRPGDLADQLLDRQAHPAWQGERAALIYDWPTNEALWKEYAELRREGQRAGTGTAAAHDFYLANREAMDAGARVAWPERFNPDEASAIEHAFNLRIDRGEHAFFAEFQNAPLKPSLDTSTIDRDALRTRTIPLARGVMPTTHSTITAAIDVQEKVLFWLVASWGPGFSGHVLAYGTHPEQPQSIFAANAAKRTLAMAHPGGGFEATLLAGLTAIVDQLLARNWKREDGTTRRIEQLAIDANWGRSTEVVRAFSRRHPSAASIIPTHGRGGGPTVRPLHEAKRKAGERVGPGWRLGTVSGQRGMLFDADFWKGYVAGRLATAVGDPGDLTFHEGEHEMLVEHLTAERPLTIEARGRTGDKWQLLPGRENHLLDCLTMAAAAASVAGVNATGAESTGRQRRRAEIPKSGERRTIQVKRWR
jgi:hypothetical protein